MEQKKSIWGLLKGTVAQWIEDQPFLLSSSLSYYTLFSLAPLLIIVIAIAGFAFGREAAEHQLVGTIQGMVGQQSAQAIQGMIQNASSEPKTGVLSAVIGVGALILGAGGVVGQLQTSLNTIWGVTPKSGQGVWGFVRQRFISFAMVLSIGFLLLVSLVISAVVTSLTQFMGNFLGGAKILAHVTGPIRFIYPRDGAFRDDLQVSSGRAHSVARRMDRRRFNFGALHSREISDRFVLGSQRG